LRVLSVVHHRNAAAGVFADAGAELVEWLPHEAPPPALDGFDAAMIFGADAQVDQEDTRPWLRPEKQLVRDLLEHGTPLLGVCFGSQLLAEAAGAEVRHSARPEIGWHEVEPTADGRADPLLGFLPARFESLQYHHYEWLLPPGAVALASSAVCLQAFRLPGRPVWGVQFHPEVTESDFGEWLDGWEDDAGAVATGLNPEAIRAETAAKIGAWNDVGREIAARFLDQANLARAAEPPA
jgi:GMP synthase (glutamine-hydrolysing)